jgi:hypothetical protein
VKNRLAYFFIICGIAVFLRCLLYRPHLPYWDAAVYLMMGKYLVSGGQAGFLEAFRPIPWPLFLGFLWKIGLDPIVYGAVAEVLFFIGNVVLVYLIGKKVFDPIIGLVGAAFFSLSPSFFFSIL